MPARQQRLPFHLALNGAAQPWQPPGAIGDTAQLQSLATTVQSHHRRGLLTRRHGVGQQLGLQWSGGVSIECMRRSALVIDHEQAAIGESVDAIEAQRERAAADLPVLWPFEMPDFERLARELPLDQFAQQQLGACALAPQQHRLEASWDTGFGLRQRTRDTVAGQRQPALGRALAKRGRAVHGAPEEFKRPMQNLASQPPVDTRCGFGQGLRPQPLLGEAAEGT